MRTLTAAYLSLMIVYGLTNMANDLWIEQIVKRGWTSWQIPDVLYPTASAAWAAMIAVGRCSSTSCCSVGAAPDAG